MKIVKYLLFLILIFVIAGSIYIATKETEYKVEKELVVNAPKNFIFSEVNNFENWKNWGPWASSEDANVSLSGKTSGEGANISWRSEGKGNGSITTVEVVPGEKIVQELKLKHSFGTSLSNIIWNFEESPTGTKVNLSVVGELSFKDKLYWETSAESIDDYYAPMLESNLTELATNIKTQMEAYDINVHGITEYSGGYYLYSSASTKQRNVQEKFKEIYPQIQSFMEQNQIEDNGRPFILYHNWDDENGTALFSVGIPTPSEVITPSESNFVTGYMPRQKVVRTTLRGDRKNLAEAWEAAFQFIQEKGLKLPENYKPFEVYITDEKEEKVPANLITEIYIPVEEEVTETPFEPTF